MIRIRFTKPSEVVRRIREVFEEVAAVTEGRAASETEGVVETILEDVRLRGDAAVRRWAEKFDGVTADFEVSEEEMEAAREGLSPEALDALMFCADSVRVCAEKIMESLGDVRFDFRGHVVRVETRPVEAVLCYAPGGGFSLASSLLMAAVTARAAGVSGIHAASPAPSAFLMAAASVAGVKSLYRLGGAQALAAFAFGTETVPKVDMIVGPGNVYVTEAKRLLFGRVGIDALAGPSELFVFADSGADADAVALDLLAQAEHAPDSICVLATADAALADAVEERMARFMSAADVPRWVKEKAKRIPVVLCEEDEAIATADELAPEHIELLSAKPESAARRLRHYGALFCGYGSSAVFGDYCAATNHILPTGGASRFASALSPLAFLRVRYRVDAGGGVSSSSLAECALEFARREGLFFHAARAAKAATSETP